MPKSKLTLIVDGNWLLMSRLSVLNNRFVDELELNQELKLMLSKSINVDYNIDGNGYVCEYNVDVDENGRPVKINALLKDKYEVQNETSE